MSLNMFLLFREQEQNITWPTDNSQRWGENESKVCHIKKNSPELKIGSVQILPFVERICSGCEWNKINIYKVNQMFADDLLTNRTGDKFRTGFGTSIEHNVQQAF